MPRHCKPVLKVYWLRVTLTTYRLLVQVVLRASRFALPPQPRGVPRMESTPVGLLVNPEDVVDTPRVGSRPLVG